LPRHGGRPVDGEARHRHVGARDQRRADNRCKWSNQLDRISCSRATVTVDGATGEAPRVYMLPLA